METNATNEATVQDQGGRRIMEDSVPDTVEGPRARDVYRAVQALRGDVKGVAEAVAAVRQSATYLVHTDKVTGEVPANVTLAFRHLEDASMRLGKALQALDGGVSVYDRSTTVGA